MTDAVKAVARALATADGVSEKFFEQPGALASWQQYCASARAAIAAVRDRPGIMEEACRKAADPKTGDVCWPGVSVHRAADIVDAVLGAMLGETGDKADG